MSEHGCRQFQLPHPSRSGSAPVVVVQWVPPRQQETDPVARYVADGAMCLNGKPLNGYLADAIDQMIDQWRLLQPGACCLREFAAAKEACLGAIRLGHTTVLRPGADASYITLVAALCANAVRTVTVLSQAAMRREGAGRRTHVEFRLSRYFAGLTRYTADMLPRSMLPFGTGRRLAPVKREAVKDSRLIANVFACEVDAVDAALRRAHQKLGAPLREMYLHGSVG